MLLYLQTVICTACVGKKPTSIYTLLCSKKNTNVLIIITIAIAPYRVNHHMFSSVRALNREVL